jgi:hypothetical protein
MWIKEAFPFSSDKELSGPQPLKLLSPPHPFIIFNVLVYLSSLTGRH